jgi:AbrB family looped-hinge helix DNA binding protein
MTTTVKLDDKGRVSLPKKLREQAGLGPGDALFLEYDDLNNTFQLTKAVNPLEGLLQEALREYEAGETIPLRQIAEEAGIDLDDLEEDDLDG